MNKPPVSFPYIVSNCSSYSLHYKSNKDSTKPVAVEQDNQTEYITQGDSLHSTMKSQINIATYQVTIQPSLTLCCKYEYIILLVNTSKQELYVELTL